MQQWFERFALGFLIGLVVLVLLIQWLTISSMAIMPFAFSEKEALFAIYAKLQPAFAHVAYPGLGGLLQMLNPLPADHNAFELVFRLQGILAHSALSLAIYYLYRTFFPFDNRKLALLTVFAYNLFALAQLQAMFDMQMAWFNLLAVFSIIWLFKSVKQPSRLVWTGACASMILILHLDYFAVLLWLISLLTMLINWRFRLKKHPFFWIYLGATSLLGVLPLLIWQGFHGFPSFIFFQQISQDGFVNHFGDYLTYQLLLTSGMGIYGIVFAALAMVKHFSEFNMRFLFSLGLSIILLNVILSFIGWQPSFLLGNILILPIIIRWFWWNREKMFFKGMLWAVFTYGALSFMITFTTLTTPFIRYPNFSHPISPLTTWKEAAFAVESAFNDGQFESVPADQRRIFVPRSLHASRIYWYSGGHTPVSVIASFDRSDFHYWAPRTVGTSGFLIIPDEAKWVYDAPRHFKSCLDYYSLTQRLAQRTIITMDVFQCHDLIPIPPKIMPKKSVFKTEEAEAIETKATSETEEAESVPETKIASEAEEGTES